MSLLEEQTQPDAGCKEQPITFHLSTEASWPACRAVVHAGLRIIAENVPDEELSYLFQLSLFEACSNVVRHAYPHLAPEQGPGKLEVALHVTPGKRLEAVVRDWGVGFESVPVEIINPPPEQEQGRGLFIISQAADDFAITPEDQGVSVRVTKFMKEDQWIRYE